MGLKEKRAVKSFEENSYPELKAKITDTVGFDLEIEVHWDTLAQDRMEHVYEDSFPKVYFQPVIQAFEDICQDDMGKEALQEVLKKIVIKNEAGIWSADKWASFADGVLTLDHDPTTNADNVSARQESLLAAVEL